MAQCSGGKVESGTMDSLALEQERGITIMAKVTSTTWKGCKINIVDTPGYSCDPAGPFPPPRRARRKPQSNLAQAQFAGPSCGAATRLKNALNCDVGAASRARGLWRGG